MEFKVLSRQLAFLHKSDGRRWAAIQIGTGEGDWPELDKNNLEESLRLNFADYSDEEASDYAEELGSCLFEDRHAEQILDFVDKHWDNVEYFVIHCTAGFSRSPAVAAAIQKIRNIDDSFWFRTKAPNMRVYTKLLEANNKKLEY